MMDLAFISDIETNKGLSLEKLQRNRPVMLVFLRHFGCTFCRQALADIAEIKPKIEKKGIRIVFVHMSDDETADSYFEKYNIDNPEHISDPKCQLYERFGLVKGSFKQLFGLSTWIKGVPAATVDGHGLGKRMGDDTQMPGIFVLQGGNVHSQYVHKLASNRPDYFTLAKCCMSNPY